MEFVLFLAFMAVAGYVVVKYGKSAGGTVGWPGGQGSTKSPLPILAMVPLQEAFTIVQTALTLNPTPYGRWSISAFPEIGVLQADLGIAEKQLTIGGDGPDVIHRQVLLTMKFEPVSLESGGNATRVSWSYEAKSSHINMGFLQHETAMEETNKLIRKVLGQ